MSYETMKFSKPLLECLQRLEQGTVDHETCGSLVKHAMKELAGKDNGETIGNVLDDLRSACNDPEDLAKGLALLARAPGGAVLLGIIFTSTACSLWLCCHPKE